MEPSDGSRSVDDYTKVKLLGHGTYGKVFYARRNGSNDYFALKQLIFYNEVDVRILQSLSPAQEGFPVTSLREIRLLRQCVHPNIVRLLDVVVGAHRDSVFLVFEFCEHDLSRLLKTLEAPFPLSTVKQLTVQLLEALKYLHDHWIIHRDLKMSNLLYTNKGILKVADFGLARLLGKPSREMTQRIVTLWYRAPELLMGRQHYDQSVDIWSVGCIVCELILNKPVLAGADEMEQLNLIFALLGAPRLPGFFQGAALPLSRDSLIHKHPKPTLQERIPDLSDEVSLLLLKPHTQGYRFLSGLLDYDPLKRLTAADALAHPFLAEKPFPRSVHLMPTFPSTHPVGNIV